MTDIYQVSNYTPCQIGLVKGDDGINGIDGVDGTNGRNGRDGKDGLRGLSGSDGKSNYQLALDSGFIGSVGDYLASMKGDKGLKGDTGADAAIDSMTIATSAAGTNASVVTGGTPIARTFKLTIPRGDKGEVGTSATITSVVATTGVAGSTASVAMGGTPTARTFNFTIPRGDKGATGEIALSDVQGTSSSTGISQKGFTDYVTLSANAASRKVGTATGNLVERGADGYPANNNAIGVGQTWQNMTASRAASTSYINSTGKTIAFAVYGYQSENLLQVSTNGTDWVSVGMIGKTNVVAASGFGLVPSGHYYRLNNGSFSVWSELR